MIRDPRIEPSVGDEIGREFPNSLALNGYVFRKVTRSHRGFVFFIHDNGHRTKPRIVTLTDWIRWAKCSEIIEVAAI